MHRALVISDIIRIPILELGHRPNTTSTELRLSVMMSAYVMVMGGI